MSFMASYPTSSLSETKIGKLICPHLPRAASGYVTYERHRPEQTLLYHLIETHYPALIEQLEAQGKSLPLHVHQEFDAYLKCGRLEHGFLRVRCDNCHF